jgi:hypothetical protein
VDKLADMLKRWWRVGAVIVVVAVVAALLFLGRGAPASPAGGGQATGGPLMPATATVGPGGSPSGAASGSVTPPTETAANGSALTAIAAPPKNTLSGFRYAANRNAQTYDVRFRPYGTGPAQEGHGTVAVAITSFTATKPYGDPVTMPSGNALLQLGPGVSVSKGGDYTGVVTLTRSGQALVLMLTSVKAP